MSRFFLQDGFSKSESIMGAILSKNIISLSMNFAIPGNTIKHFQVQCSVVFIGKFNLVTCQNMSDRRKNNLLFNFALLICETDNKSWI